MSNSPYSQLEARVAHLEKTIDLLMKALKKIYDGMTADLEAKKQSLKNQEEKILREYPHLAAEMESQPD